MTRTSSQHDVKGKKQVSFWLTVEEATLMYEEAARQERKLGTYIGRLIRKDLGLLVE